jgi:adenylate cyclase
VSPRAEALLAPAAAAEDAAARVAALDAGVVGVLDQLGVGVAVADVETLAVRLANARFQAWFPAQGGLLERLAAADAERARERLGRGRPYVFETEVRVGPRVVSLRVELRRAALGPAEAVLAEAVPITRQKEAEYMLDSYSRMVERQNRALEQERTRADRLLLNIMPRRVYEELKEFGTTTPQSFPSASVLLLDFVGFTERAISRDPAALIAELNDIFTSFDRIVEHFRCERIKTIGDAYMAVAGVPEPDPDHDHNLARAALRMRRFIEKRNRSAANKWLCRIGIGRGALIGSIVGIHKYVYDIFGPAVNLAARLEHAADPMQILVAADTVERIRDDFVLQPLGPLAMKGFGTPEVYALEDEARQQERGRE